MTDGVTTRNNGNQIICEATKPGQVAPFEFYVEDGSEDDGGVSWVVILVIVLCVVAVAVVIIIIVCCVKKRKMREHASQRFQDDTPIKSVPDSDRGFKET